MGKFTMSINSSNTRTNDEYKLIEARLENVKDLYNFNIEKYDKGRDIIVYVENVNDEKSSQLSRGAFFQYNWITNNWRMLVLGNHTHGNIDILDQLGNIDTDDFEDDEKRYITIDKNKNFRYESDNSIKLPKDPDIDDDRKLFLSVDKDGNKAWNTLTPAQTFKVLRFTVDKDNIDGESNKVLRIDKEYLEENNFHYNEDCDEIIVFDSGSLTENIKAYYKVDLYLEIDNDKPNALFELGESIVVILLRSGISGLLDTLDHEFVTKKDLVNYFSNGKFSLENYVTKKELEDNYAKKDHIHNNYLNKTDYDMFDWRYADYQHTHDEYMTKYDVMVLLQSLCDEEGNVNTDLDKLANNLTEYINLRVSECLTAKQTITLVDKKIAELEERLKKLENQ